MRRLSCLAALTGACLLLLGCGTVVRTTADLATDVVDATVDLVTAPLP
jgi:hypothetical protein